MRMTRNIEHAASRPTLNLAVLLSGSGRTLENIQHEITAGRLNARIKLVISSTPNAYGLQRASKLGLPSLTIHRKLFQDSSRFSETIWPHIRQAEVDMVCLAGFLCLLTIPPDMEGRVINIHPALLPAFGGYGMFGHHVHEAVLAAGCKVTGCTVHMADNTYDTGPIIVQRACPVLESDTCDSLAARVFAEECIAFPHALHLFQQGKVKLEGRIARISS